MHGGRCADELDALVAAGRVAEIVEEPLPVAQEDRRDRHVQLIEEARPEELPDRARPAGDQDVFAARGLPRLLERRLDAAVDEVERRAALHRDGRMGVVGEHVRGVVVRRIVSPPAGPLLIAPGSSDRTEHVAPHDRGADPVVAPGDEIVVDARFAAVHAEHIPAAGARCQHPFVEAFAADAERFIEALIGSGAVPVERDREIAPRGPSTSKPPRLGSRRISSDVLIGRSEPTTRSRHHPG